MLLSNLLETESMRIQRPQGALCSQCHAMTSLMVGGTAGWKTLTTVKYQDEVVKPNIKQNAPEVGCGLLLVHVNARHFVAGACQQFRDDEAIDSITGPILQQTWSTSVTSCIILLSPQSTREWTKDHRFPDSVLGRDSPGGHVKWGQIGTWRKMHALRKVGEFG